jgi:tight adherence protein B
MRRAILGAVTALGLVLPASAVAASAPVQVRHVDLSRYPLVRVTAVVPKGTRPTLLEAGRPAGFAKTRELGMAEAMMLAVDNSESMAGRPLREAKRAATQFLANEQKAGNVGVVAFGHEALALTHAGEVKSDVARTLAALGTDTEPGTSLYDAVQLSVSRLKRMSSRTRILVLLTDGRDRGSQSSLSDAISAAQQANVVVFAIAAGEKADREPLAALTTATGGRIFKAADPSTLSATYAALGQELARTWQISYLTAARPGDRNALTVQAGGEAASAQLDVPKESGGDGLLGSIPSGVAHSAITAAAVVLLAALLLAGAGVVGNRRRRTSEIGRLLESHVTPRDAGDGGSRRGPRFAALLEWTEESLEGLPGSQRLARSLERSGLKLRLGYVPYIALFGSFFLGIVGTIMGAGAFFAILFMLVGLATPILVFQVAGRRRSKAFDKQLPDVLSTIASTLRAGHGFRMALRAVADDGTPPASEEFTRVLGEERLGRPLDQAIAAMCERIGSEDMDYVATAVNVQSQAGGSLATLFDTLSDTVRERQRHARKVRALTSMGRMSAGILICLPIGLAGLMTLISPHYMAPFFTTSAGHMLTAVCLTSMGIGALVLKKIVNVRY